MKSVVLFICLVYSLCALATWDPFVQHGVLVHDENGAVTLQCDGIPLGTVLQVLSEKLNVNLLLTQPLEQPVTLNMRDVSREHILNDLLQAYALKTLKRDELTVVLPASERASDFGVKTYVLKYASAQDVSETLKSRVQTGFDARTNALIIYNAEGTFDWLDALVATIDIPAKQVYIEATIMNASKQFTKALGLRFEVDEFSVATWPEHIPLKVAIEAAQENHQTNVMANPKLLTLNLQEAHIKQGKQLAYQENSASGATSLTFHEAALELKVTPMITPENDIVLSLMVKQDRVSSFAVNGQPTIDTKSIQAKVRVKDGETVVLGGIYSQSDHQQTHGVPWLAGLPLIGRLFQEKRQNDDKDELLIFVTPQVVI